MLVNLLLFEILLFAIENCFVMKAKQNVRKVKINITLSCVNFTSTLLM